LSPSIANRAEGKTRRGLFPYHLQIDDTGLVMSTMWARAVVEAFWGEVVAPSDLGRPRAMGVPKGLVLRHTAERWVEVCQLRGEAPALVYVDGATLSYRGMLQQAARLAATLHSHGVGAEDVVAVDAPRHLGLPVWILGIWLAGAVYLPLGSRDGVERKRRVMEVAGARLVLVGGGKAGEPNIMAWGVPTVDVGALTAGMDPAGVPAVQPVLGRRAFLLTTSGSTGEPKILVTSHCAFSAFVHGWQSSCLRLEASDRVPQCSATSFDIHVEQNVLPCLVGGCAIMVMDGMLLDSEGLFALAGKQKASSMFFPPSVWSAHLAFEGMTSHALRQVISGGEKLEAAFGRRLVNWLGTCGKVINVYAPAECTIVGIIHEVDGTEKVLPLGRALSSHQVHIGAPEGVIGELWIGGPCVMDGYLNAANPVVEGWYPTGDLCSGPFLMRTPPHPPGGGGPARGWEPASSLFSSPGIPRTCPIACPKKFQQSYQQKKNLKNEGQEELAK